MKRNNFKYELDASVLDDNTIEEVMKVWDYCERKYKGEWYDCGSLSCRCSECGCKAQKPTLYCPNCGEKMAESEVTQ